MVLNYIQSGELYHGENALGQPDVLNRPLKELVAGLASGQADAKANNLIYKVDSAVDFEATVVDTDLVIYDTSINKFRKYEYGTDPVTHVILGFADVTNEMVILRGFYSFFSGLVASTRYYASTAGDITDVANDVYVGTATDLNTIYIDIKAGTVDSVAGKVGDVTLVKGDVGLGNVDNTSDADKPISTATQSALDNKLSTNVLAVKTAGTLRFNDNVVNSFGSSDDAELFCNGSHFYLDLNSGIGNFYIRDGATTRFTFDDAGSFTATGDVTAYSDKRIKTDIERIPNAIEKILQLNGYTYSRIDEDTGERHTGVIAQEVLEVLPEAVKKGETEEDIMSVAYGNLAGLFIEAIKELKNEVEELKKEITVLKG